MVLKIAPTNVLFCSFHEKAIYDLPAIIDKILEITYSDFVYYLGNSQGATLLLALCATYPDYGYKIERAMLLAPLIGWDYRTEEQAQLLEKNYNELMVCTLVYQIHYPPY